VIVTVIVTHVFRYPRNPKSAVLLQVAGAEAPPPGWGGRHGRSQIRFTVRVARSRSVEPLFGFPTPLFPAVGSFFRIADMCWVADGACKALSFFAHPLSHFTTGWNWRTYATYPFISNSS